MHDGTYGGGILHEDRHYGDIPTERHCIIDTSKNNCDDTTKLRREYLFRIVIRKFHSSRNRRSNPNVSLKIILLG